MTYSQLLKTLITCFFLLFTKLTVQAEPPTADKQVLIIHSYHSGLSWTDSIMNGIRDVFDRNGYDAQMSAEYLDARRVVDHVSKSKIETFVISKIQGTNPDLVIVSDNAALIFILKYREQLFPKVPIIFCGINDFQGSMISNYRSITGVAEEASVIETVNIVLQLHPTTKNIIVIGRTSIAADKYNRDAFVANLPFLPVRIQVTFWDDLSNTELRERIEKLEQGTVLFLNGLIMDQDGRQLMYAETTKWVSSIAKVPVYSLWDVYLGYGIVGGMLISGYGQGELTGEIALRVLSGENADRLSIINGREANRYMFDYHQLKRFDISVSKLPKNSLIINRPDSFYFKYKNIVWLTMLAVSSLSGIIIFLIITIIRRRKVEKLLQQANLVVENSLAVIFRWKAMEGWPVEYVSNNITRWGYTVKELLSGTIPYSLIVYPDDLEKITLEVEAYSAYGEERFKQEYRIVTKDGDIRWVDDLTVIERDASGLITHYQGIVIDITDRKNAEEALRLKTNELDRIFSLSPDLLCIADMEGRFVRLNPAWEQALGYPLNELEGRMFIDFVHPDDVKATREAMADLAEGKDVIDLTNRYRSHDGTYRWIEWHATPYQKTLIYAAAHDVTERKQVQVQLERSLRETHVRFEVSKALVSAETEDGVLNVLIQHAGLYPQAFVVIFTFDKRGSELAAIVRRQNPFESGLKTMVSLEESLPSSRFTLFNRLSAEHPFISEDIRVDERVESAGRKILKKTGAASFAMFPLKAGNEWMGIIMAMAKSTFYFDEEKKRLYQTLSEQGAVALRAARLREIIRESQQRYQGLVETLSDWIWEVDENGVYTYVSPKVKDLLGYEPEEVLRKTPFDFMPPDEAERVSKVFKSFLTIQQPLVTLENTNRHKAGHLVVFETSGVPFFDAKGRFKGYRGIDRDITERKRIEEALKESEEHYRLLFSLSPLGIVSVDKNGLLQNVNEKFAEIIGFPREKLIGFNTLERIKNQGMLQAIKDGLNGKQGHFEGDYTSVITGKTTKIRLLAQPVSMFGNKNIAIIGIFEDITERKKIEDALLQSEKKFRTFVETTKELIWMIDLEGKHTYCNPEVKSILGYEPEELIGFDNYRLIHPEDLDKLKNIFRKKIEEKDGWSNLIIRWKHKDGTFRYLESNASPIIDSQGNLQGFQGADRDITERKEAEEAEAKLREQLFQSQKMETVGLLAGGVAHDFNNLLTPILGYSELMLRELPKEDANRQMLEHVHKAASLAKGLTSRLLTFSRKQMLELQVVNVGDIIKEFERMLHSGIRENIKIKIITAPSISLIYADKAQIEQALLNLAVNAQDSMPEGGVLTIEVKDTDLDESYTSSHPEVTPGPYVMLLVSDTGMGIDEKIQGHIFEPFFTTKEFGKGTGLGLATVYGIVKQHGGSISVYSEKGRGSIFKIFLPRITEKGKQPEERPIQLDNIEYGKETILVVEDNESVRVLVRGMLEGLGYKILMAGNVDQCIEMAKKYQGTINLLLTDVIMPDKNGKELYELLKCDRPEIKVLFMSGYTDNVIGHHGILEEGVNFLHKPFTLVTLSQKVRMALES